MNMILSASAWSDFFLCVLPTCRPEETAAICGDHFWKTGRPWIAYKLDPDWQDLWRPRASFYLKLRRSGDWIRNWNAWFNTSCLIYGIDYRFWMILVLVLSIAIQMECSIIYSCMLNWFLTSNHSQHSVRFLSFSSSSDPKVPRCCPTWGQLFCMWTLASTEAVGKGCTQNGALLAEKEQTCEKILPKIFRNGAVGGYLWELLRFWSF